MSESLDKWKAVQAFWGRFGVPAYEQASVPQNVTMPYITYNGEVGAIGDVLVLSGSVWARDTSWEWISKKADEIAAYIGHGYTISDIDGGYLWITRGQPFAQRMSDEDPTVKRIYINCNAEFLTAH